MNKVKPKKCRVCKNKFTPFQTTQIVCSQKCALKYAVEKREKEQRKNDRIKKESFKTARQYLDEAQSSFNRYIRARDRGKLCCSCNSVLVKRSLGGGYDAGHYRSRGAASHLRFNLLNVWGQCKKCNLHMGGNYSEYRKRLVDKIGLERVERLENDNKSRKFTIDYLKRIKKIFNKRAKYYERKRST